ncbi:hypothetical protein H6G91_28890 [Nostoc muscorum FACHB-395]|nr:hypothetical protein [Desmonostoc muscorum FACHB-395]
MNLSILRVVLLNWRSLINYVLEYKLLKTKLYSIVNPPKDITYIIDAYLILINQIKSLLVAVFAQLQLVKS